jgi:uncharacterized protein (TIGR03118 family)
MKVRSISGILILAGAAIFTSCSSSTPPVAATGFVVTPLTADTTGYGTTTIDTNLKNPWGVTFAPGGPIIIANNHSGTTTFYDTTGKLENTIAVPGVASAAGAPSGVAYNADQSSFIISGNGPSEYVYVGEDGILSGWSSASGKVAIAKQVGATANYKGDALGTSTSGLTLYAANFNTGKVDLYNSNFGATTSGADPSMPSGFAPFNVTIINNQLYVAYAMQKGDGDDLAGAGNGFIDIFSLDGVFQKELVMHGALNSPWGMTIAPDNFGDAKGKLLVGNFGDGKINIFDPSSGNYIGTLNDASGHAIVIDGLWSIVARNGIIYYTAGAGDEAHGIFGKITVQ